METFILVALAVPLVTAVAMFGRQGMAVAWREAAKSLGLTMRGSGIRGRETLTGHVGSAQVIVDKVDRMRDRKTVAWTRVRASGDIPAGLMVGGEGFWRRYNEEQLGESVEMAGVAFDDHVIVRGSIPEIFALLNGDTRAQFRELERRYRAYVVDGVVHVEHQGVLREPEELAKLVRRVASVAMALSIQGPSIADRLGANVVTDANALVRQRNLEVLLDRYPETASARLACEHAMGDRFYGVSVLAARHSGEAGVGTLERVLSDDKAPVEHRLESLRHLVERLEPQDAAALLARTVDRHERLQASAVVMLAEMDLDPGTDVLLGLLRPGYPEGWIAFSRAIALLARRDLAPPLEALIDERACIDSVEFRVAGPDWEATVTDEARPGVHHAALSPEATTDLVDDEVITVEIAGELRVDLEVQQAAEAALLSLTGEVQEPVGDREDEPDAEGDEEPEITATFAADDMRAGEEIEEPASSQESGPMMMEVIPAPEPVIEADGGSEMELEAHAE